MQLGPRIDEAKRCPRLETYPTFLHHDKQGGFLATKREKAPPKIHSAQVIRTELDPLATAAEDLGANIVAPFRQPPRAKRTPTKASESPVFPPPAPIPAWARASGRRGRAIPVCRRRRSCAARRSCASQPARRRSLARPPGAHERRSLRKDPASHRRRRRAARPALRRRERARARRDPCVAVARFRRPASTRAGSAGGDPARPRSAGPDSPLIEPEDSRREGRPSVGGCEARRRRFFPPSRTPQRPKPKSSLSRCSTSYSLRLSWSLS
jgi:hypothetical protein